MAILSIPPSLVETRVDFHDSLSNELHSNLVNKPALRQKPKLENKPGVSWNVPISEPGSLSSLTEPMETQTIKTKPTEDMNQSPSHVTGTKMTTLISSLRYNVNSSASDISNHRQ